MYFNTLNDALNSVNLIDLWPVGTNIDYNQTKRVLIEDGKKIRLISVYRNENGRYESPITYLTN